MGTNGKSKQVEICLIFKQNKGQMGTNGDKCPSICTDKKRDKWDKCLKTCPLSRMSDVCI